MRPRAMISIALAVFSGAACASLPAALPNPGSILARRDAIAVVLEPKRVRERPAEALRGTAIEAYLAAARAEALLIDERLIASCAADDRRVAQVDAETVKPVDTVLVGLALSDGRVLREAVTVSGCASPPRRHVVYPGPSETGLAFVSGVPGASIAPLRAQQEAVRQVVTQAVGIVAADVDPEGCDALSNDPWVLDSAVSQKPKDGAWRERWIYTACGGRYALDMQFATVEGETLFETAINIGEPLRAE